MKWNLLDRIERLEPDRIIAIKQVSLAEEYLADHFPTFPVLPGVMMLESITQAASWLLNHRTQFRHSVVVLQEARNVKYGQFVAPGRALRVEVEWLKDTPTGASFKASGSVDDAVAVTARIELAAFSLADKNPELAALDARLSEHTRSRWAVLTATATPIGAAPALAGSVAL